jgi:hypothetical protein
MLNLMMSKGQVNVKFTLEQITQAQTGVEYSTFISLTSALDGVGCERHDPALLPSVKTRFPL